jgi:hypothetical protein
MKVGMKNDVLHETTAIEMIRSRQANEELQSCWQVAEWNPQGKCRRGRPVNTWTACKAETSRLKNVSIESSAGGEKGLGLEENCVFTRKKKRGKTIAVTDRGGP